MVPLIPQAKELLKLSHSDHCFKTFTNQATNRFLKLIMDASGIDKKITYHFSRHTFGTRSKGDPELADIAIRSKYRITWRHTRSDTCRKMWIPSKRSFWRKSSQ
jgi:integrase